ncbi:MAG: hypothetical protein CMJ89_06745 [Planctomycetes bacterium]|nr:hypothetical protein [Planctomycetota bacterium]
MTGCDSKKPWLQRRGFLLLALAASATCGQAQEGASTVLGTPVSIDGVLVPAERLQREICLGPLRERWLDIAALEVIAENERQRRIAAGEEAGGPHGPVSFLQERVFAFDVDELQTWEGVGFVDYLRRLFLPDDPDDYPPATLELESDPRGQRMLEQMRMVRQSVQVGGGLSEGERHLQLVTLQVILRRLLRQVAIVEDIGELPSGVLLRIDGSDVSRDSLWPLIEPVVSMADVRQAKKWVVNLTLLEHALRREGVWLSDEQARASNDRIILEAGSLEALQSKVEGRGFPSIGAYLAYRRVGSAFGRLMRDGLSDEALAKHHRERLVWIEAGTVDVDVLLLSAYDFEGVSWKPDGWAQAEERTRQALHALVEGGRPWEEILREFSEFPPSIGLGKRKQKRPRALRGEYPGALLNHGYVELLATLEENEYTQFVNVGTVTSLIFFGLEEGECGPAVIGRRGWLIPFLHRKTRPNPRRIQSGVASQRNKGTYFNGELLGYLRRLVEKSDIRGL